MAKPLRELPPGSAWNEAVRRGMAASIAGFFVPNLLAEFGVVPQLHQSFHFIVGVCGAAGVFFMSIALFIGHYHGKAIQGLLVGSAGLALPYSVTWLWFRMTHPLESAGLLQLTGPPVIVAIALYVALMRWHASQSKLTSVALSEQLGKDEYGKPTDRWEQVTYRVCSFIGSILILLLIIGALSAAISVYRFNLPVFSGRFGSPRAHPSGPPDRKGGLALCRTFIASRLFRCCYSPPRR